MIFWAKDNIELNRQGVQGGQGQVVSRHPFNADNRPENTCFKMVGQMTLPPGASVGEHTHTADEEIYLIVSGRGLYTKNDGSTREVGPGDLTMTRKGERHGLANIGPEALHFIAVIAA
ncbi:MAG: cupin domain-containing protein [Candidatus Adiutrix sp.]|jgi:quercetin dioxygenase-like cupin family protein|nr:cupin domain-containing protein [Candidatus Adiutrix sp.]